MRSYQDVRTEPSGEHIDASHLECFGDLGVLSRDELKVLLVGSAAVRNWLSKHWILPMDETIGRLQHYCDPPSANHKCFDRFCTLWNDLASRGTHSREAQMDPLCFLKEEDIVAKAKLCENCETGVRRMVHPLRDRLWKCLPALFNLVSRLSVW